MTRFEDLKSKVVLVTGGANGIGAAIVRAFHAQGARVHFCDVDTNAGAALASHLGGAAHFTRVDLLREAQIKRWINAVGKKEKAIHVLVNNAAADPRIPLEKTSAQDWDRLFARNLRAYFLTARGSVKWMSAGAAIINFSSLSFHQGLSNLTAYVATKGGILGFTRSLARELGPRRIRVNTVSPGWIMTERQLREFLGPQIKQHIKRSQCIPELNQPEEIADVVLFLASNSSRIITGQEILADRGWYHS